MLSSISTQLPPESGALVVILLASIGLLWELRSASARAAGRPSLWICLGAGALALLLGGVSRWVSLGVSIGSGLLYARSAPLNSDDVPPPSRRSVLLLTLLGLSAIAVLLLFRLDPNLKIPLVWESVVIMNLLQEIPRLKLTDALGARFLWTHGLVSDGDYSLLYGFPTVLLLSINSSLTSLRIVSVILFLGATYLIGSFCRRFLTPTVGVATLLVFGLNEVGLIFGRYASSLASSLFSIIFALYCCALCVSKPSALRVALASMSLFLATLGYSPARLTVLVLLGAIFLGLVSAPTLSKRRRVLLTSLLCAGIAAVTLFEDHYGRLQLFTTARYEQFFGLFLSGTWPDNLLEQWNSFAAERRAPNTSDYAAFVIPLVADATGPQLLELISPFSRAADSKRFFYSDPLHQYLYDPYLFPFLFLGFVMSRRRASKWLHRVLLVWLGAATIPILFTNRVDSYRTCMAIIPLSLYIGLGIAETIGGFRRSRFPQWIVGLVACGSICGITLARIPALSAPNVEPPPRDALVNNLEPRFIDRALIGVDIQDFRGHAQTQLLLLRRKQRGLPIPATFLSNEEYAALTAASHSNPETKEKALSKIEEALNSGAPVILAPRPAVDQTVRRLSELGFKAYPSPALRDTVVILK